MKDSNKHSIKNFILGLGGLILIGIIGTLLVKVGGLASTLFVVIFTIVLAGLFFITLGGPYWAKRLCDWVRGLFTKRKKE